MSLKFHWFLPTYGDSRFIVGGGHGVPAGVAGGARPATIDYLGQIARSAEQIGFEAALTPTGAWCEDAWLMTAMLNEVSDHLKFLVAFRPGLMSPTLAAQMASTFQNSSKGRLLLNIVVGGEAHEQRAYGDFLDKDDRYVRADEWLGVVQRLWKGERVTYAGHHVRVEEAHIPRLPNPVPPLYFGGSSPAAGIVAARHSDVYLTWGEPLDAVAKKIEWIRDLARQQGRTVRFGIRLHVIARDSAEAAWAEAQRLLDAIDPETIANVQQGLNRSQSEGQKRMLALHGGSKDNLLVGPNLWAGVGLVRGGAGTALVGSHSEIADRIREYADIGIEEFVLSGVPHLEEAYWFGEGVLPILRRDGLWQHPRASEQPAVASTVPFAPVTAPEGAKPKLVGAE